MAGLTKLSILKLACATAGIATFGVGVRFDDARIRWVGIALVATAWLLRLGAPRRTAGRDEPPPEAQLPDDTR